jgi:hypothetical protein
VSPIFQPCNDGETAASDEVNLDAIHCVVPYSVANFRMLVPSDRNAFIFSISDEWNLHRLGLPTFFPVRLASAMPALPRSQKISRPIPLLA